MTTGKRALRWLTATSLLTAFAFTMSPAVAQQAEVTAADDEIIEEIITTGSRIPRAGFDTMLPAIVIDSEFISDRAFTDVASALNEIPAFGSPLQSTNGDQNSFSIGQNFVDFFGIGSQRTLTLVNGRRFVSSNSPALFINANAGLQVDLNMIPTTLIERVETIAVGGAPIYGADAIAGTVNVIMKDDFEGFDVGTSFGVSSEGEMEETKFSAIWGANMSDGRGNVVLGVEYTDREGMIESDMPQHAAGWQFREPTDPNSPFSRVLVPNAHANIVSRGGAITPGTRLLPNFGIGQFANGQYLQFAPDGSLVPYDVGTPTGNAVWSVGGEGIFLPDVTNLYTPLERTLVNSFANYQLTDSVEAFGEVWVAHIESTALAEQPAYQSGFFGEEASSISFPIDHPLLTASARQTLQGLTFDDDGDPTTAPVPITEFYLQRASVDLRPNNNGAESEMNLIRVVGGFQGDFDAANRYFTWDLSYNFGRSVSDVKSLDLSSERFFYALDVVDDGNGGLGCRVTVDPSSRPADPSAPFGTSLNTAAFDDCVPLDIFGDGRPSDEAVNYISVNAVAKTVIKQQVVSGNIGTDLFELPAGTVGIAGGFEFREEFGDFQSGGFSELGLGRSTPITSVSGEYETDEYYVEFFAPMISDDMDIPFMQTASIEGAWRTVDNTLAGRDETWTIGGRFAPVEDIEFRGNVTQSVRAPAITELFLPLSGTNSFANDPCDLTFVNQGPNPSARRANCIADGIADPDSFVSNVRNASVQGVTGGNLGLKNEVADAWTFGAVIRPRWVEGLTVAIDYVDIDIQDAIESFTLTQIMESCYDQAAFPNPFCGQFTRQANGQLPPVNAFQSGFVNAGVRLFRGITAEVLYTTELAGGQIDVAGSLLNLREDLTAIQESVQNNTGEVGQANWQGNFTVRYSRDKWMAMLQPRFIGGGKWENDDEPLARDILEADDVWIVNGAFTYELNENVGLQFNINNIFDELPTPGAVAAGDDNVYDNIGRFFRFGVTVAL